MITLSSLAAGPVVVRLGWHRNRTLARSGWALMFAGAVVLGWQAGPRAVAIGVSVAMASALAVLLYAACATPAPKPARANTPGLRRPPRTKACHENAAPAFVPAKTLRGLRTFLLCGPAAIAASAFLAWAAQRLAYRHGWPEADSTALALFGLPLIWTAVMSVQLLSPRARSQIIPLLVMAGAGCGLWLCA